ncbi:MFS general substrate transporter [Chloropicon roscoffensis]|uniref:MFS general substrate transporter n=1 Tax=Chloropicon roscoffensis TaxID=1461544 RepID=A0AAX4P0V1_9CHLO
MQLEKSAENLAAVDGEPGGASPGGVQGDPSSLKRLLAVPGIVAIFVLLNFTVRAILATLETLSTYIISYLYRSHTHILPQQPRFRAFIPRKESGDI